MGQGCRQERGFQVRWQEEINDRRRPWGMKFRCTSPINFSSMPVVLGANDKAILQSFYRETMKPSTVTPSLRGRVLPCPTVEATLAVPYNIDGRKKYLFKLNFLEQK